MRGLQVTFTIRIIIGIMVIIDHHHYYMIYVKVFTFPELQEQV